jgi:hypothetical protein
MVAETIDEPEKEYAMIHRIRWICFACFVALVGFATLSGCLNRATQAKKNNPKTEEKHDHAETGPHGGPLAEWEEIYHAEFTVDHGKKQVVVYILGEKPTAAPTIEADKITKVKLTVLEPKPQVQLDLVHDAKLSDAKGIAFVGTHDVFAKPADLKLSISGNVDGKPYVGDVTYAAPKETALYLQPGGIYSPADVLANGNTTPDEKFKGKRWIHHALKPGDRICPVTDKKANAECAWIVQGQRYEFCCPPCLDTFMGWAHYEESKIKDADTYVNQVK